MALDQPPKSDTYSPISLAPPNGDRWLSHPLRIARIRECTSVDKRRQLSDLTQGDPQSE